MKTLLYANRAEPKSISVISILLLVTAGDITKLRCMHREYYIFTSQNLWYYSLITCYVSPILSKKLILYYILPIIKNKNKISDDSYNYRPICISSCICKIIEKVIYNRISSLLVTLDSQFGFLKKLGTEMCVFALE